MKKATVQMTTPRPIQPMFKIQLGIESEELPPTTSAELLAVATPWCDTLHEDRLACCCLLGRLGVMLFLA